VEKEREKFAKISEKAEVIAMEPPFKVNTSQLLDPESASYKISVEIPLPIDVVCDVVVFPSALFCDVGACVRVSGDVAKPDSCGFIGH
jgi:hypothetical protein